MAGGLVGPVNGAGGGSAGNDFFSNFLAGRQSRLAQEQYEYSKQHDAVTDAQKQYELETQRGTAVGSQGAGEGLDWMDAKKAALAQRQAQAQSDQSDQLNGSQTLSMGNGAKPSDDSQEAQGPADLSSPQASAGYIASMGGLMAKPPGSGFVAPPDESNAAQTSQPASQSQPSGGSNLSTVPSVTATTNPGSPQAQGEPVPPQPMAIRMAQYQAHMAQLKEAQDMALKLKSEGGNADVVPDEKGGYTLAHVNQGAQKAAELNNATAGNRSAQETGQKEFNTNPSVAAARQSKVYMDQMLQSRNDPSPQGQASLLLNALRIKFPTAPDVGSLEELRTSESAPTQMKNAASKYLNGTMDPGVVDNLVRDGISTYESNVGGFRSAQKDYQDKLVKQYGQTPQAAQLITHDSGIDQTAQSVAALKQQIGPYQTPAEKGGLMGKMAGLLGFGKPSSSNAASSPAVGSVVKGYKYLGGDPSKQSSWSK